VVAVAAGLDAVDVAEDALEGEAPETMAWSMRKVAVTEGMATPMVVNAAGTTRPKNERFIVCPCLEYQSGSHATAGLILSL
jgi:hypothetical protein